MVKQVVLVEITKSHKKAFEMHAAGAKSRFEAASQVESFGTDLPGIGLDLDTGFVPVPMFFAPKKTPSKAEVEAFGAFSSREANVDRSSASVVVRAELSREALVKLRKKAGVRVYPASPLHMIGACGCVSAQSVSSGEAAAAASEDELDLDWGNTAGGTDCRPFRPGVSRRRIRQLLGVRPLWRDGFRGQNVVVAIVDEGVNGDQYPVIGGYVGDEGPAPGTAPITSHGSMCAADVMVAAPLAKLYDYPLIAAATSADGVQMYQQILERRRLDGTPHITNNSYGFYGIPSQAQMPEHEAWDIDHPFHRKVREVIATGIAAFFAAGNCGQSCPSGNCQASATGPGRSINSSAALREVFTIAAINSRHERVGYSSQGPSLPAPGFEPNKPDLACYTHFFGNFGPGRPGGSEVPFDNGTSAACPTAAGVAALLMSRFYGITPARLREALTEGAVEIGAPGWDALTGHGAINAGAAFAELP